ncbi:uncharacterized protein N7479_003821 [Penicillium vulpinum]|uniref:uncharacterized protein n=1 Tax=Penicillium vulpinum TaxID=29845 RepID=UPI0025481630|nr:uncharacterized protein N7479_003821 [Penicillium vulpinum]KAJ5963945.1 hypothetical protein N7479_003821 [Penicillium vulpinum]
MVNQRIRLVYYRYEVTFGLYEYNQFPEDVWPTLEALHRLPGTTGVPGPAKMFPDLTAPSTGTRLRFMGAQGEYQNSLESARA